jgi:acetyl esterase
MSSSAVPSLAEDPVIEPATDEWLTALAVAGAGGPALYELSPADARQVLRDIQASVRVDMEPADVADRSIPGGPTGEVDIRIVRPQQRGGALPAIVYTHGGGWILGDKDTHERLVREIANAAGAVVVFVDYTPAPEVTLHRFMAERAGSRRTVEIAGGSHAVGIPEADQVVELIKQAAAETAPATTSVA